MNVRIEKDFIFDAAMHFENNFLINNYYLNLSMTVLTDSTYEQNIAIERINYFLNNCIENSIFVSSAESKNIEYYEKAGLTVLKLPEEPYDQIIACVLMLKLNSIMEEKIHVDKIVFGSKLTAGIKFNIEYDETEEFAEINDWWNDPSTSTENNQNRKKDKVVKLFEKDDWKELGLLWKEKKA
jgi:hypothetical protein